MLPPVGFGSGKKPGGGESRTSGRRRTPIWDLHSTLHCSIIGTCLSSGELRRLLVRLNVSGAENGDDHDLHMLGVLLAARPQAGAKLLQKTLDRCHRLAVNRFTKAKDAAELSGLWDEARSRGEIPGAYWAILTHPASTGEIVKRVFGHVHMLSHLVGATNRADIRRLHQLEEQNTELAAKVERQQTQLREGFVDRDRTIHRLNELLAQKTADEKQLRDQADQASGFLDVIRELERHLDEEMTRRQWFQHKLELASAAHEQSEAAHKDAAAELDILRQELITAEMQIGALVEPTDSAAPDTIDLSGVTVLYVGGRAKQLAQLKAVIERTNGHFLHHDGGVEQSPTLLPALVGRADVSLFPVDCVSHDAVAAIKRVCRQTGKRYIPLRTSSLTSLLSALATMRQTLGLAEPGTTLQ